MSYLAHLESPVDGARFARQTVQSTHLGRPLLAQYDVDSIRKRVKRSCLSDRPASMWRYHELLPLANMRHRITLDERITSVERYSALGESLGQHDLWIKDETTLPTGSFKSRGISVAVSMARELSIRRIALPTAGNAGAAIAAYAAAADLEAFVFMPADAPVENQLQAAAGARLFLVDGLITDCGRYVQEGREVAGWYDFSTLREPYRLEGKKTMGFELAEQFDWHLPDVIVYPTGGGTGLIGMWKAFRELADVGWLDSGEMPRMVAVQSTGCEPIVRAWNDGARRCRPFREPNTIASGLRVPSTIGDSLILQALRESGGRAVSVPEDRISDWMEVGRDLTGLSIGPESATCLGAVRQLREEGWLRGNERTAIFNCGPDRESGCGEVPDVPLLDPQEDIDWSRILSA